jgi:GMP synthase (glutamine-hydrolysing)
MGLNVKGVDAGDRFLSELAGVSDQKPNAKYRTCFIEVLMMHLIEDVKWLAQGTIYQMLLNLFL